MILQRIWREMLRKDQSFHIFRAQYRGYLVTSVVFKVVVLSDRPTIAYHAQTLNT